MKVFVLALTLAWALPIQAQTPDLQAQVAAITSVKQIKNQLRATLQELDQCGVGSCANAASTSICEQVGALDVRVDGKIIGAATGFTDRVLPISPTDLKLMKLVWSQCQPTNYQYWNFPQILHVAYNPSPKADAAIRKGLGVR